jgi:hypothetical protein
MAKSNPEPVVRLVKASVQVVPELVQAMTAIPSVGVVHA